MNSIVGNSQNNQTDHAGLATAFALIAIIGVSGYTYVTTPDRANTLTPLTFVNIVLTVCGNLAVLSFVKPRSRAWRFIAYADAAITTFLLLVHTWAALDPSTPMGQPLTITLVADLVAAFIIPFIVISVQRGELQSQAQYWKTQYQNEHQSLETRSKELQDAQGENARRSKELKDVQDENALLKQQIPSPIVAVAELESRIKALEKIDYLFSRNLLYLSYKLLMSGSLPEPNKVFDVLIQALCEHVFITPNYQISIAKLNDDGSFTLMAERNLSPAGVDAVKQLFRWKDVICGLSGQVAATKQQQYCPDVSQGCQGWVPVPADPIKMGSALCIPVLNGRDMTKECLAVLTITCSDTNSITPDQINKIDKDFIDKFEILLLLYKWEDKVKGIQH